MTLTLPPDEIIGAIHGSFTRVTVHADIYEADGVTPWMLNAPLVGGSVSISGARDERRTADIELENIDGSLTSDPLGFWYDKIIKLYRGATTSTSSWEQSLGEFLIDSIKEPHFPHAVSVTLRDQTKKLLRDKFPVSTTFARNDPIEEVIRAIAINGGIPANKIDFPLTGKSTGRDFVFDHGTERWKAMKEIAEAYNYDLFFRGDGFLTMVEFQDPADPAVSPAEYTFETGTDGNLVTFERSTSDARLYNHIVVTGESADTMPVTAEAENDDPNSPTRISRIGRRSYFYTSSFITTKEQAQAVADRFLKVHALEQFEVNLEAIVVPYLDANIIVEFYDPRPNTDPTRFLLSEITIPLTLGSMSATARRVTLVDTVANLLHDNGDLVMETGGVILI